MEKMIDSFNIRVYGLVIIDNKIMILEEPYAGEVLFKFPGGGLEFGEGLKECLQREFKEELNLEIKEIQHFYTQEEFVQSKFRTNEQLLTIYYKVDVSNIHDLQILEKKIRNIIWIDLNQLNANHVNLPVDQLIVQKLK